LPSKSIKRKLEVEAHTTLRVEGTVKEADAELSSKEYDYKVMLQQLDQLKGMQGG